MALNQEKREQLVEDLRRNQYLDMMEHNRAHILKKNEFRGLTRFAQVTNLELEREKNQGQAKQAQALEKAKLKREENLANELDEMRRQEICEIRNRQALRENCHELRELESKLRCAYTNKTLAAQLAEKELERLEGKAREKHANELMEQAILMDKEIFNRDREEAVVKKIKYKQELQDQMILQEQMRRYQFEEFLREKKMIDDIIQRIHEEDERMQHEDHCKLLQKKEEMIKFKEAQQIWRQRERKELEEENQRIEEYIRKRTLEEQERKIQKDKEKEMKIDVIDKIARKIHEEAAVKKEREDIIQQLLEQEHIEELERRHCIEVEKLLRSRLETRHSLKMQMQQRQEQLAEEAKRDAAYKEQCLAKIMDDERIEQLSTEKRRLKMVQLRKDVEQMMIDRRQKRAEEMQNLIQLKEMELKEQEKRRNLIETERIRMLKEHAANLIGYLPRGVLRHDDLEHLDGNVQDHYKSILQ